MEQLWEAKLYCTIAFVLYYSHCDVASHRNRNRKNDFDTRLLFAITVHVNEPLCVTSQMTINI